MGSNLPISCLLTIIVQEDSVLLWKEVCSNKLLAKVDLVLFLNKCDILELKLKSGVRLQKYVRSFGDRANDPEVAQKCGYMRVICAATRLMGCPRRLQEQVQRHPSRAFTNSTEILRVLHIGHCTYAQFI